MAKWQEQVRHGGIRVCVCCVHADKKQKHKWTVFVNLCASVCNVIRYVILKHYLAYQTHTRNSAHHLTLALKAHTDWQSSHMVLCWVSLFAYSTFTVCECVRERFGECTPVCLFVDVGVHIMFLRPSVDFVNIVWTLRHNTWCLCSLLYGQFNSAQEEIANLLLKCNQIVCKRLFPNKHLFLSDWMWSTSDSIIVCSGSMLFTSKWLAEVQIGTQGSYSNAYGEGAFLSLKHPQTNI